MDKYKAMLKLSPMKKSLKTMPGKEGCQPGAEFPPSIFDGEPFLDRVNTYVHETYGVKTVVEKTLDKNKNFMRWVEPIAPGVREERKIASIHSKNFRPLVQKDKKDLKDIDYLYKRKIAPLTNAEVDRPVGLYRQAKQ